MLRVRCQAEVKLDDKGRLPLPAALKTALSEAGCETLVLAFHKGAIWGWTEAEFEATVEGPLARADQFDADVIDFTHSLLASAQNTAIDAQGRIRIAGTLRELARLDREIVVNSVLNRIEIWDAQTWNERFTQAVHRTSERSGLPGRVS